MQTRSYYNTFCIYQYFCQILKKSNTFNVSLYDTLCVLEIDELSMEEGRDVSPRACEGTDLLL